MTTRPCPTCSGRRHVFDENSGRYRECAACCGTGVWPNYDEPDKKFDPGDGSKLSNNLAESWREEERKN